MFDKLLSILVTNFIIIVAFILISRSGMKDYMLALIYAVVLGLVGLPKSLPPSILLVFSVGNFIASLVLFKFLRYFENSSIKTLLAIIGCLILWYITYLPLGYALFLASKKIGI